MYSLKPSLAVAVKGKQAIEGLLGVVHFRERRFEAGASARSASRWKNVGDLLDAAESLQKAR